MTTDGAKQISLEVIDRMLREGREKELLEASTSDTMRQAIAIRARFLAIAEGRKSKPADLPSGKAGPAISVIVPVYNTKKYLAKCLDSILQQTFTDFEVICVDDCSTDDSWDVLKEYEAKDSRIRLIKHESNKGLGGARNTAIKAAKSEYLASVDSDDYIAPNMLEVLHAAAQAHDACIIVCGFQRIDESGRKLKAQRYQRKEIENHENSVDIFSTCNPAFWNKLWRRSLFVENGIYFPDYVYYQDLATTPRLLTKAKKIAFIEDCPYFYLIREGSATYSNTPKHFADYYTVFGVLRDFLRENGLQNRYEEGFRAAVKRACKFRAENIIASGLSAADKKKNLAYVLSIYNYFSRTAQLVDDYEPDDYLKAIDEKLPEKSPGRKIPISIIVKTICRPELVERFLCSVGKYQERWRVQFDEVLVGDDSPSLDQTENERSIKRAVDRYPALKVRHLKFEYDIGCSAGRNALTQAANSEFILQCDDDFIIDGECDFLSALGVFKGRQIDIMGGWLKNKYDTQTGEFEYRAALGRFEERSQTLRIVVNEDKYEIPDYSECHFIMNFFIARREAMLKNPWDNDLKTEEHHEFFYRAYKNGLKVAFSKLLFARHTYEKPNNSASYNAHRFEKGRWKKYLFMSLEKCGVNKRIIETVKWDKVVVWEVDRIAQTTNERSVSRSKVAA